MQHILHRAFTLDTESKHLLGTDTHIIVPVSVKDVGVYVCARSVTVIVNNKKKENVKYRRN